MVHCDFERQLLIWWDCHVQPSLGFLGNGLKERKQQLSRSSQVGGKKHRETLDVRRVRGQRRMASWHRGSTNSNNHFCTSERGAWPEDSLDIEEVKRSSQKKSTHGHCEEQEAGAASCSGFTSTRRNLLRFLDGRVRIWCKRERNPLCLWPTVPADLCERCFITGNIVSAWRPRWVVLLSSCISFLLPDSKCLHSHQIQQEITFMIKRNNCGAFPIHFVVYATHNQRRTWTRRQTSVYIHEVGYHIYYLFHSSEIHIQVKVQNALIP